MSRILPVPVTACPLCGSAEPSALSHLIPAFVFDYLRETSATGFMRFGPEPNLRVQDGFKQKLLCDKCEGLLSLWEGETASSIFKPYHAETSLTLPYGSWFGKFCASVCWRVLFVFRGLGLPNLSAEQNALAGQALDVWREIIREQATDPSPFELHLIPVDVLESATGSDWPPNINRYLARAVEMDVAATPDSAFVYAKLCKLIVVGFIQMKHPQEWIGTKVSMATGVVKPSRYGLPTSFGYYLADQAKNMARLNEQISRKQKGKIWETAKKDADRAANSETFRAMQQDVAMFGRSAFAKDPEESNE